MVKIFRKIILSALALSICTDCTNKSIVASESPSPSPSPTPVQTTAPDCLTSLSKVATEKDEDKSSKDVETEGDKFEAQGKGQEALNKYSEAYLLYSAELGYATGRAMRGDPSASAEMNTSINSAEFPFKVGRTFAKTGQHEMAVTCFTESLDKKIASPNDASAYLNRAEAYLATGQKEQARADYQTAANLFQQYKLPQYQKMAVDRLRSMTP